MEKTINVSGKELKLKASLFTIISYKNTFGSDLFEDVNALSIEQKDGAIGNITTVIKVLFQIIYILHKPYTKAGFEEFVNEFDFSIISDTKTLEEITNTIGELLGSVKGSNGTKTTP